MLMKCAPATGSTDAYVVLVWDKGLFTNVEVETFMGVFSPAVSFSSLTYKLPLSDQLMVPDTSEHYLCLQALIRWCMRP